MTMHRRQSANTKSPRMARNRTLAITLGTSMRSKMSLMSTMEDDDIASTMDDSMMDSVMDSPPPPIKVAAVASVAIISPPMVAPPTRVPSKAAPSKATPPKASRSKVVQSKAAQPIPVSPAPKSTSASASASVSASDSSSVRKERKETKESIHSKTVDMFTIKSPQPAPFSRDTFTIKAPKQRTRATIVKSESVISMEQDQQQQQRQQRQQRQQPRRQPSKNMSISSSGSKSKRSQSRTATASTAPARVAPASTTPPAQNQPRIPEALQQIFLAAAQGQVINEPPKDKSAWKLFRRGGKANNRNSSANTNAKRATTSTSNKDDDNNSNSNSKPMRGNPFRRLTRLAAKVSKHSRKRHSRHKQSQKKQQKQGHRHQPMQTHMEVPNEDEEPEPPQVVEEEEPQQPHRAESFLKVPQKSALKRRGSKRNIKDKIRRRNPQEYLNDLLEERGYSSNTYLSLSTAYHCDPSEIQQASYGSKVVQAAHQQDVALLGDLFDAGLSPNPCNVFGESLIHMVCRRGCYKVLKFMLSYGSTIQTTDEVGRTPLHEACWSVEPNFQLIRLILDKDIALLRVGDGRGVTPLSYVAKKSWVKWIEFIDSVQDDYWPRRDPIEDGIEPPPKLATMKPNSVQVPDPDVERTLDVVAKIASGALDLNDPWITQYFYEDDGTLSSSDGEEDETICSEMFGESDSDSDSDYDDDDDDFDNDSSDISESDNISQMLERYDRSKKKKMSAVSWPNNERSNSRGSTAVMSSFSMVVDRTPSQRSLLMVD